MAKKPKGARKGSGKDTSGADGHAADRRRPEDGVPIEFENLVSGLPWVRSWRSFVEENRAWWDRVGGDDPVYALPIEIIESLAEATKSSNNEHRSTKPLIAEEDAKAERDFLRVCHTIQGVNVGIWDDRPIAYPLLTEQDIKLELPDEELAALGWTEGDTSAKRKRRLEGLPGLVTDIHHQLLGYVGALTFDVNYRREKADLQARWKSLPDRPPFPLNANVADRPAIFVDSIERYRDRVLGEELEQFLVDFGRFMRKWRLNRMVTWELPEIQGPLSPVPVGLQATILGPDAPATHIPSYFDIPSTVDLREVIREQQRQAGIDDGIEMEHPVTNTSSRGGHASQYESAFRMWLIERAVRSRYGDRRGLVTRLNLGFSRLLPIAVDRAQQLRQIYVKMLVDEG